MVSLGSSLLLALLAALCSQAAAIGRCDNAVVKKLMDDNSLNCPQNLMDQVYSVTNLLTFRVVSRQLASTFSCLTGVLGKPENNVIVIYNKFTYTDTSLGSLYVNFTVVEARCGMLFKYIVEDSYVGFKVVLAYADTHSIGFYGCTDEDNAFADANEVYTNCYSLSATASAEQDESLAKCKAHLEEVVGDTDLVELAACDNNNEFLPTTSTTPSS